MATSIAVGVLRVGQDRVDGAAAEALAPQRAVRVVPQPAHQLERLPPSALRHSACGSVPAQTTSGSCGSAVSCQMRAERGPGVLGEADRRAVGPLVPGGAQVVGVHHRRAPVLGAEPREQADPARAAARSRGWAPRASGTAAPRPPSPAGRRCAPATAPCVSPPPPLCSPWLESGRQPPTTATLAASADLVARTASRPT